MRPSAGFTLVEVLVVMAIISVLAGIVVASISVARRHGDLRSTAIEIQTLAAAANSWNGQVGDFPPSLLAGLKVKGSPSSEGIEALVLCLSSKKKGGPFFEFKEDRLANLDNDSMSPKDFSALKKDFDPVQNVPQLFEYTDLWGNPFVYIHNRDYKGKISYVDGQGNVVPVTAAKSGKLGTFQAPTGFQIWSFGPNRKNENGEGDDIASWQ